MGDYLIPIMALSIPIVAVLGGVVVQPLIKLKQRQIELQAEHTAEKAAQYAAHTERLEQRVRVLERIVTDKGVELSEQIEHLRDERPAS